MKKTIKLDIVCQSCNGTGLYSGMCERNGSAVVCYDCNGTGKYKYSFSYEKFKARIVKKDIKRVFKTTCGFVHSASDVLTEAGKFIEFSKAGCSYKEWLRGVKPKPVKELYCPYLWANQDLQLNDVNNLYKNNCSKMNLLGSRITNCENYNDKEKCWKIFENEKKNNDTSK
jgi:hypothetical protein